MEGLAGSFSGIVLENIKTDISKKHVRELKIKTGGHEIWLQVRRREDVMVKHLTPSTSVKVDFKIATSTSKHGKNFNNIYLEDIIEN